MAMRDIELALRWRAPRLRRKWQELFGIVMLLWAIGLLLLGGGVVHELRSDPFAAMGLVVLIPSALVWVLSIPVALWDASKCYGSAKSWRASTIAALIVAVPTLGLSLLCVIASLIE